MYTVEDQQNLTSTSNLIKREYKSPDIWIKNSSFQAFAHIHGDLGDSADLWRCQESIWSSTFLLILKTAVSIEILAILLMDTVEKLTPTFFSYQTL